MHNVPLSPDSSFLLFSFILRAVGPIYLSLLSFCSLQYICRDHVLQLLIHLSCGNNWKSYLLSYLADLISTAIYCSSSKNLSIYSQNQGSHLYSLFLVLVGGWLLFCLFEGLSSLLFFRLLMLANVALFLCHTCWIEGILVEHDMSRNCCVDMQYLNTFIFLLTLSKM